MRKCSKRNSSKNNAHPIATGETVVVIGLHGNVAFFDGIATIKGRALRAHHYKVEFAGERRARRRVVHPITQRDAIGAVEWLNELLRIAREPDPDDFFPDDL